MVLGAAIGGMPAAYELKHTLGAAHRFPVINRARLAFDEVPGLGPEGHTQSVCHVDHALLAGGAWQRFEADPGPIVIGAVQGASCFGPAYEYVFIIDADLRKRRICDRVPITFVTSEPHVGHLGLGGVGDSKGLAKVAFEKYFIRKMKKGTSEPFYEKTVMRALRIEKLKA
jgi:sulfide:quinone oxidoreductase